jgi:hypothetical protein
MGDCRKRQTATATQAEPGELLFWFSVNACFLWGGRPFLMSSNRSAYEKARCPTERKA